MTLEGNDRKDFKVEDRRTSSGKKEEEAGSARPQDKKGDGQPGQGSETRDPFSREAEEAGGSRVDFSTFLFSLFSSALIQMGDMADPTTGKTEKNLQAARQTIDILDILLQKTAGNLTDEEDKLLKNAAAELKWKYIDSVKQKG